MDMNNIHIDERIILSFLKGECSEYETEQVLNWMNQSEQNQQLLDQYEKLWFETGELKPQPIYVNKELAWDKLENRISESMPKTKKLRPIYWISAAVAIVLLLVVVGQLLNTTEISTTRYVSYEQKVNNYLPDSTLIYLNKNSKIELLSSFNEQERRLKLEGEAFFKVKKDKSKKFTVVTKDAFVEVLGTEFNVNSYKSTELYVREGIVKFYTLTAQNDTNQMILYAGEKAIIRNNIPVKLKYIKSDELFWMDKSLIFKNESLENVIKVLQLKYKVKIAVINEELLDYSFSSSFKTDSIKDILEILKETLDLKITQTNNTYILEEDE
jgi:ferric-dicitrate binding protein FerR (iron transport regulator)